MFARCDRVKAVLLVEGMRCPDVDDVDVRVGVDVLVATVDFRVLVWAVLLGKCFPSVDV
jgi:hypothetical protein